MPSRRSSLKLVALQMSAVTPKSALSSSAAAITSRRIVPEPTSWTRSPFFAVSPAALQEIEPLENSLLRSLAGVGERGMLIVLVHQGDVVVDVLLRLVHAAHAFADDRHDLVGKGRVVRHAVRNGGGEDVAVAILVLQPLAVQRGAAGGAAEQEAASAHVAGEPGEVADALQAEHRIVDVERDHRHVVRAVGRRRDDPARHRAAFVDALLQNLAGLVLAVVHQLIGVLRPVELADR